MYDLLGGQEGMNRAVVVTGRLLCAVGVAFVQKAGFAKSNFSIRETVPGLIRPGIVFSYTL